MINSLRTCLPEILWRHRWSEYREQFGVPYSKGTMQNKNSAGTGPKANKLGSRTYYLRTDYLEWLAQQLKQPEIGNNILVNTNTKDTANA